jgi:hypothetical protein
MTRCDLEDTGLHECIFIRILCRTKAFWTLKIMSLAMIIEFRWQYMVTIDNWPKGQSVSNAVEMKFKEKKKKFTNATAGHITFHRI